MRPPKVAGDTTVIGQPAQIVSIPSTGRVQVAAFGALDASGHGIKHQVLTVNRQLQALYQVRQRPRQVGFPAFVLVGRLLFGIALRLVQVGRVPGAIFCPKHQAVAGVASGVLQ